MADTRARQDLADLLREPLVVLDADLSVHDTFDGLTERSAGDGAREALLTPFLDLARRAPDHGWVDARVTGDGLELLQRERTLGLAPVVVDARRALQDGRNLLLAVGPLADRLRE